MTLDQQAVHLAVMSLTEKNTYMDSLYAESEALLGKGRGLTYQQLVDRENIFDEQSKRLTAEALRKRIQRRRQAQERLGTDLATVIRNRQQQILGETMDEAVYDVEDEYDYTEVGGNKFATTFRPTMAQALGGEVITDTDNHIDESDETSKETMADIISAKAGVSKDQLFSMFMQLMQDMAIEEVVKEDKEERQHPQIQPIRNKFATGDSRKQMYAEADESLDDTPQWEAKLRELESQTDVIDAIVLSDIHFPDHNIPAMKLALNIIALTKPRVILIAGDTCDFDAFSSFAKDPHRRARDPFSEVQDDWDSFIDVIKEVSPNSVLAAFTGNHDKPRLDRYNAATNSPFMGRNERDFVNMMRSKKRVMWLHGKQETYIGGWYVQHGKKTGETAAKSTARQLALYGSSSMGHTHTPGWFVTRANDPRYRGQHYHLQMNVASGCLCNIPPHYVTDTNVGNWVNGILYAHASTKGPEVNIQNIVFHPMLDENGLPSDKMSAYVGTQFVTSE